MSVPGGRLSRPALTFEFIDRHVKWLFPLPAGIFVLVMMIFPILYTGWNSLTDFSLSAGHAPDFIGLANYAGLIHDTRFLVSIVRTVYFTVVAMVVEVGLGVAIALLLNRPYVGRNIVNSIMLLPMMATPVAIAMVWLFMFEPTAGVINYVLHSLGLPAPLWVAGPRSAIPALVLVDIWEWTPMMVLISLAGLAGLPHEPLEAAKVDGASAWQATWRVVLPLLMPTVLVGAMLRMIDALKTFDTIYTMTGGGPGFASETLNIFTYQQAFSYFNFGYAGSVLLVFFAIVLGCSLLVINLRRVLHERF